MRGAKKILFLLLMLSLWLPFIQQKTHYFYEPPLKGAFVAPPDPVLSVDSLKGSHYQKALEDYLNFNFGFRGLLIKIKNSLGYLLWKEIPVSDNIEGMDGYIFSKGSLDRCVGIYYNGKEQNKSTVEKIAFLKDGIENHGGRLLVVFAPSKEAVMTRDLPYYYHDQFKSNSDYIDLLSGCREQQIPVLDFCSYFRSVSDTSRFPLFTKTGFHWSAYAAGIAHDSLIGYVRSCFPEPIPEYERTGIEYSDTARFSDNDFEEPMNLLFRLDHSRYVYPQFRVLDSTRKRFRPKVIIIGDSFFWQLKSQGLMKDLFSEDSKFWFYFAKTSFPIGDLAGVPMSSINVMQELESADLVILMGSMGTLNNFPFGVTDYYLNNIQGAAESDGIRNYLVYDPAMHDAITREAVMQKKSVDVLVAEKTKEVCRDQRAFNLKAFNGKFVCADAGRNNIVVADKDVASTWEEFSFFPLSANTVAISSFQKRFLSAELDNQGKITAYREKVGEWEVFTRIDLGAGEVALKAFNGKYLRVDEKTNQLIAASDKVGPRERFILLGK